jgi:type IV secretory pathway component VirB8
MLTTLERLIDRADGQFLRPEHLEQLATYSKGFTDRSETYNKVQKLEPKLVDTVLKAAGLSDTASVQEVTLMVRAIAMAMLLDDPAYFKEHYLDWLITQTQAYGSQARLHRQATLLQQAVAKHLTAQQVQLLRPFVDQICQALL